MRRTSIFSKDYEKIIKRRKRAKIILSIVLVFLAILSAIVYLNFDCLKKFIAGKYNSSNNNTHISDDSNNDNKNNELHNTDNTNNNSDKKDKIDDNKVSNTENEMLTIKLANGMDVSYKVDKKDKTISDVEKSNELHFEISEDKKFFVVFSAKTAELFRISSEKEVKNITYETFITTAGVKIHRKDKLTTDPTFIWMETPKLYKNNLYYATKLPNLNNNNRYFLWVCDVTTGVHKGIYGTSLRGNAITMGSVSEKGLEIDFDGVKKYFNQQGKEVK